MKSWDEIRELARPVVEYTMAHAIGDSSYHYLADLDEQRAKRERMKKWLGANMPELDLSEWQFELISGGKIYHDPYSEKDYIKDRLNARLRRQHVGPYQKDPAKR